MRKSPRRARKASRRIPAATRAGFAREVRQRVAQLAREARANGRVIKSLAPALGLDPTKVPARVVRELERTSRRVLAARPPRRPRAAE